MPVDASGTYVPLRWVRVAEAAKLVRGELKKSFPGVKFSVRSDSYSGGASIRVKWTDGPTTKAVDAVVKPFSGSRFDGMTDLKYGVSNWLCPVHGPRVAEVYGNSYDSETVGVGVGNGPVDSRCCAQAEQVNFGSDYVFTDRELSPEFKAEVAAELKTRFGIDYDVTSYRNTYDADREFNRIAGATAK